MERQTMLAALALGRGGHAVPALAQPGHLTVVHTVNAHVVRDPSSAGKESARPAKTGKTAATQASAGPAPGAPVAPATKTIESFVQQTPVGALPPAGEATAFGCPAALAYLTAYAAPGFVFQCPAYAGGHEATTMCMSASSPCDMQRVIRIAEPCAAAYMNEASNSWVLLGITDAPIDPYGACP